MRDGTKRVGQMALVTSPKIAAMPLYDKRKTSDVFSGTESAMPLDLGIYYIRDAGFTKFVQNDDHRLTFIYFTTMSNLIPNTFIWGET